MTIIITTTLLLMYEIAQNNKVRNSRRYDSPLFCQELFRKISLLQVRTIDNIRLCYRKTFC